MRVAKRRKKRAPQKAATRQSSLAAERLELRQMLAADLWRPIADQTLDGSPTLQIGLGDHFRETQTFTDSIVRFETNAPIADPDFYVQLYDSSTPLTVDNFLTYVTDGAYDGSIIHRSVDSVVIEGGGYTAPSVPANLPGSDPVAIPKRAAVINEPGNSNVRGTIAMKKPAGQPDGATNQWFINLVDNAFLDTDNGGYTVFGEVLGGMTVIDTMADALAYDVTTYYGNSEFADFPLWNLNADNIVQPQDFVTIESVSLANADSLLEYSVSSSRPTIANAWVEDGTLILVKSPGASGATEIEITAQSILGGPSVSESFVVHVSAEAPTDLPLPRMLGDLNPQGSSNPMNFVESGDFVYFSTEMPEDGAGGAPRSALWRTQGTASTTVQLGVIDGRVHSLTAVSEGSVAALVETLALSTDQDASYNPWIVNGLELWQIDNEPQRLSVLTPDNPEAEAVVSGQALEVVNGKLLVFGGIRDAAAAEWDVSYTGLWAIDPATGVSQLVSAFNQASPQSYWYTQGALIHEGLLYFFGDEGDGPGLYQTDGTSSGTRRLRSEPDLYSLWPDVFGAYSEFAVLDGKIVYATVENDPILNVQVGAIVSFDPTIGDPSYTGSTLTRITQAAKPSHLTVVGNDLYFLASESGYWDHLLNEYVPGDSVVYAFDLSSEVIAPVFSVADVAAEAGRIFSLTAVDDALVVGAGSWGTGPDARPSGELWTIRRHEGSPPTLGLTSTLVPEDAPTGTSVGSFQITDSSPEEEFLFELIPGEGDAGNASFVISGDTLHTDISLDFETQSTFSIRVRATGDRGTLLEHVFAIDVLDIYEGTMSFVSIGNPGNAPDPGTGDLYGDVPYEYEIGAFEITIGEYAEFLNAVATSDPYSLYHEAMASDSFVAGIERSGEPGSYSYQVMSPVGDLSAGSQSAANRPITYISWYDAARFANWMHNGQGNGSTESGAYELHGMTGGGAIARNADAKFSLPTEDEWYKAAYYSPLLNNGAGGYYVYATQSNTAPGIQVGSLPNQANYFTGRHATTPTSSVTYQNGQNYLTDVGAFSGSASFYGTFDQTGNVWEWNDLDGQNGPQRGFMGGMWNSTAVHQRSDSRWVEGTWNERDNLGFRLVKLDPRVAVTESSVDDSEISTFSPGYRAEQLVTLPHELFVEDGLFTAVEGAVVFATFDSSELYVIRPDESTGEIIVRAAPAPWVTGFSDALSAIDRAGNQSLHKDADGRLYVSGTPVLSQGRHVTVDSFAGWLPIAAETVGGVNKLLWQNQTTSQLRPWQFDTNWAYVATGPSVDFPPTHDPTLPSPPAVSPEFRQLEIDFGRDFNSDWMIGDHWRYQSEISTSLPPLYIAGGLSHIFFAQRSLGYGLEPWALPFNPAPGDRFERNDGPIDAILLGKQEGVGGITGLSIHVSSDLDFFDFEITRPGTSDHFVSLVAHGITGDGAFMEITRLDETTGLPIHVGTTASVAEGVASITLAGKPAGKYSISIQGDAVQAVGEYDLEWSLPIRTITADDFEANNSSEEAAELLFDGDSGSITGLTLHSAIDTDWFRFTLNQAGQAGDHLRIQSDGAVQASLFRVGEESPVQYTDLLWDNGVLSLDNLAVGEYTLEIQSWAGEVLEYDLVWQITSPPVTNLPLPRLVGDLSPAGDSWPRLFTEAGDRVYFVTDVQNDAEDVFQTTLWSTNGVGNTTTAMATFQGSVDSLIVLDDGSVCFLVTAFDFIYLDDSPWPTPQGGQFEVWRSDGTPQGTRFVTEIPSSPNSIPHGGTLRQVNGEILAFVEEGFFAEETEQPGLPNFSTETRLLNLGESPEPLASFVTTSVAIWGSPHDNGDVLYEQSLYFTAHTQAEDGSYQTGLWRTDGTVDGTVPLTARPSEDLFFESWLLQLAAAGNGILFTEKVSPDEFTTSRYSFATNTANTLADATGSEILFSEAAEAVVISVDDSLYFYDAETSTLRSITTAVDSQPILGLSSIGGRVYFSTAEKIWTTEIAPASSQLPLEVQAHPEGIDRYSGFVVSGNSLVYVADNSLWLIQDADTATTPVSERVAAPWRGDLLGTAPSDTDNWRMPPYEIRAALGSIFFGVGSDAYGVEPWVLPLALDLTAGDQFEPNDTQDEAFDLGMLESVGFRAATIHSETDIDYYRFSTTAVGGLGHELSLTLADSAGGDLDFDLYRYAEDELQFVARSATSSTVETIPFKGLPSGEYAIKVHAFDSRPNGYALRWDLPTTTTLSPDAYEPNDTELTASPIQLTDGFFHERELSIHSEDDLDFFSITLEATGAPESYIQVEGDANIDVWVQDLLDDPALAMFSYFDSSNTLWGNGRISLSGVPAGDYVIGVASFGTPPEGVAYELTVDLPTASTPSVPEDWAEPNNSQTTAFNLFALAGSDTREGLTLHSVAEDQPGDVDLFRFELLPNAVEGHAIDVLFNHLQGDIDIQLLDAAGAIIRRGNSLSNNETVSLAGLQAGVYFLKIIGKTGPTGDSRVANAYTLRWNAPLQTSIFTPDAFEPNNTRSDAYDFRVLEGSVELPDLSIHNADDRDWYRFEITTAGESRHAVEVLFSDATANLDARLYNSQGRRLATAASSDDNEKLALGELAAGVYFVEVYASANADGGANTYTLRFNTPSPAGDDYEINDSSDQATWLGQVPRGTLLENLSIHTVSDTDFYKFELTADGTWRDSIVVQFEHALGDLDVELIDAFGNSVGSGASVTDDEALSLQGLAAGSYVLEVYGFSGATNDYIIEWQTPDAASLSPDWYEPLYLAPGEIETIGDAYWLGPLEGAGDFPSSFFMEPGLAMPAEDDFPTIHNATDSDFWRFQTTAAGGNEHEIRVAFDSLAGDLDIRLYRSTATGFVDEFGMWVPEITEQEQWILVDEAATTNDIESISFAGLEAGDYCLEVYGFDGATNVYSIDWSLPAYSVEPDRYEPNDLTATLLEDFSDDFFEPDLTLHNAADIDRYGFTLQSQGAPSDFLTVVNHDWWSGDSLVATLRTAGSAEQIVPAQDWGFESYFSLEGLPAGDYELTVSVAADVQQQFAGLNYEINGYFAAAIEELTPDDFEQNDTPLTATLLRSVASESFSDLTIHTATDVDYFSFALGSAASPTDRITVNFRHQDGDLDAELLRIGASGEEIVSSSYSVSDNEHLELAELPAGEYFVKVFGYAGATNQYSLEFNIQETTVRADRLESNDMLDSAHRLRTVSGFQVIEALTLHSAEDEDWFGFQTIGAGDASHFIGVAANEPGFSIAIYDADGSPVRTDVTEGFSQGFVTLDGLPSGQYFARVLNVDGLTGGYDLFLDAPISADAGADWTIMVYVTASDLFDYAFADINEMEKAVSELPGSVNITAFWDQSSLGRTFPTGGGTQPAWGGAGQAIITADSNMEEVRTVFELLGEQNSGDPATLQSFVEWSRDSAPADRYALILWDHGAGLEGFNFDNMDEGLSDNLTTEEVVSALRASSGNESDTPAFDLLAFDACLMASTEVAYAVRDVTDIFVASQEVVGGDGYDYTMLLDSLKTPTANAVTPERLAEGFVRTFANQYEGSGIWDTHAAIRTSGYDTLTVALREFSSILESAEQPVQRAVASAIGFAHTFTFDYLRDLGSFMTRVARHDGVSDAVKDAASAVGEALDAMVIAQTSDSRQSSGLSIYMPPANSALHSWYASEYAAFLEATAWDTTLATLQRGSGASPQGDWLTGGRSALNAFSLGLVGGMGNTFGGLSLFDASDSDWLRFEIRGGSTAGSEHGIEVTTSDAIAMEATLYDANGLVEKGQLESGRISLEGLPDGVYSLRLSANSSVNDYQIVIDAPPLASSQGRSVGANDSSAKAVHWGVIAGTHLEAGLTLPPRPLSTPNGGWQYFEFDAPRLPGALDWSLAIKTPEGIAVEAELFRKTPNGLATVAMAEAGTTPLLGYQTFGESETFVLKVRQSTVTAAGVAFHVQFQRGASEELISPVERTGNRRLGRNTAGDVFSNTVPITYGEASLNIRFHDRWDIVDAEETVDGRNYVFAQAGGDVAAAAVSSG